RAVRSGPRSPCAVERPNAPLPDQGGSRGSRHRRRFALRSRSRHHHLPRSLKTLNSHTAHHGRPRRRRRGGARRAPGGNGHGSTRAHFHANSLPKGGHYRSERPQADYDPSPLAFDSLGLEPSLLEGVAVRGFERTTPIQSAVIPIALAGHNVIGCADTGTGKTVAFVLPILHRILTARAERPDDKGFTRVLILAP